MMTALRTIRGDGTEEQPITFTEALNKVAELALEIGGQHEILGAALLLIVRCAPYGHKVQHRLLTASAAMVEMLETRKAAA
jgi:hypothetical protein